MSGNPEKTVTRLATKFSGSVAPSGDPRHRENRENGKKKIPVRENTEILSKHREFCLNTGNTQGILLAQVVNVLILKVKDIAIVAAKKIHFFPEVG